MAKQRVEKSALTRKGMGRTVAERLEITEVKGVEAVQITLDLIAGALGRGERLELRGLGTFEPQVRAARQARNPRTGGSVQVPAMKAIRYKPSKSLLGVVGEG